MNKSVSVGTTTYTKGAPAPPHWVIDRHWYGTYELASALLGHGKVT